jgi:serine phosphatase RsbU (regulator of sigma subunit)
VDLAVSVHDALEQWRARRHDVLICESDAPGDGFALLNDLSIENSSTQVVMLSASNRLDDVVRALRLGASDYVTKPIDVTLLLHAVSRSVAESRLIRQNLAYQKALEEKNRELNDSLRALREDQEAGRAVQLKMLPPKKQVFDDISIEYEIFPSLLLSGDFIDFFRISKHQLGFYLADVSGHGASSAFVTILLKNMANRLQQTFALEQDAFIGPNRILAVANEELLALGIGKHLATFCATLDTRSNQLTYCSAAHFPPPVLITENQAIPLPGKGLPVGLFEGVGFEEHQVQLGDTFTLVIFSDGVLELLPQASVNEKEQFLLELVAQGAHNIDELVERLAVSATTGLPDDIALMTVKRG